MSPRLLFLLNARNAPSPRGLSDRDSMDAQTAAARMRGQWRAAKVAPLVGRIDRARLAEPSRVRTAVAA